ncbi:MAG: hypothetical protein ACMXYL_03005 [Candidatus Woesearchaeota archaeon]
MGVRNTIILSSTIIAMLLLASCGPTTPSGQVFEGGTQGILFRFVEGTPPSLIYDAGAVDFDIMLSVQNAGEFDVDRIHFTISGINDRDFPGTYEGGSSMAHWVFAGAGSEIGMYGLAGKTRLERDTLPGDTTYVTLASGVNYTRTLPGGGELRYTLHVDACYPYATMATSTVCYQRDYLDGNDNICSPAQGGQLSVSGAPLQVTRVTQTAVGSNDLRLQYTFELKSNVDIWAPKVGNAQTCDPINRADRIREEGVFFVALDHLGAAERVRCIGLQQNDNFDGTHIRDIPQTALTGAAIRLRDLIPQTDSSGYLKLVDGKATLTCTLTLGRSATNNLGTVNVLATYYVKDSARTSFSVTHSGMGGGTATGGSGDDTLPP